MTADTINTIFVKIYRVGLIPLQTFIGTGKTIFIPMTKIWNFPFGTENMGIFYLDSLCVKGVLN